MLREQRFQMYFEATLKDINKTVTDIKTKKLTDKDHDFEKYAIQESSVKKNWSKIKGIYKGEIIINIDNDELIGCVFVGDKKDKGFIHSLWVSKKYRRKGFATILMKDAIHKLNGIDLTVSITNKPAISLYKKLGFVIISYGNEKTKSDYWMKLKSKLSKNEKQMYDK